MTSLLLLTLTNSVFIVAPYPQLGNREDAGVHSLTLLWQTADVDQPFDLRYKSGAAHQATLTYRTIKVRGMESYRVYSADLTDLQPDSKVEVTLAVGKSVVYRNAFSGPRSESKAFQVAIVGDNGRDTEEEARVAFQIGKSNPDMTLITGDIVYNDGRVSEYRRSLYPYYAAGQAKPSVGAPVLNKALTVAVSGNHDTEAADFNSMPDGMAYFYHWSNPSNGPVKLPGDRNAPKIAQSPDQQAFLSNAGSNFPGSTMFSFDYGNSHWTILDSNEYVDWSDERLRSWVRADLQRASGKQWRFVAYHHPGFHSSKKHQSQKQMRQLQDIFEDGKVDVVFSGHVHNYQRSYPIQSDTKRGLKLAALQGDDWKVDRTFDGNHNKKPKGVIYVVNGAGGAYLYNPELNSGSNQLLPFQQVYSSTFSFGKLTVNSKSLTFEQRDHDGKLIDSFQIDK